MNAATTSCGTDADRSAESEIHKFIAYGINESYETSQDAGPFRLLSQYPSSSHPRALHGSMLFFEENSNAGESLLIQARNVLTGHNMFFLRVPVDVADLLLVTRNHL